MKDSARALADALEGALNNIVEKDVRIGKRLDIAELIDEELRAGWGRVGVLVSGPGGLCDDVRSEVAAAGRRSTKTVFELEVDAYSW
jgi:hypothetical protein